MTDGVEHTLDIETGLNDLSIRLKECRAEIASGVRVDLVGLDRQVNRLCIQLVAEKPDSQRFLPRLEELVDELNALAADLKTQAGRE